MKNYQHYLSKYILILSIFAFLNVKVFADTSMRRCLLLPVQDTLKNSVAYKVYDEVELFLKESNWCYYQSSAGILNILDKYKSNLNTHLKNPKILKLLASKMNAGSLIKIEMRPEVKGVEVKLEIIGENGEDKYFIRKSLITSATVDSLAQQAKYWLNEFEKIIPYSARVIGIIGDQFTIDMGKDVGIMPGDEVIIKRPIKKKKHPLLKEIVDWETRKIAQGKIFHSDRTQAHGKVYQYASNSALRSNDWVETIKKREVKQQFNQRLGEDDEHKFGRVGTITVLGDLGSGSVTTSQADAIVAKIGGFAYGVDFRSQLWITRHIFTGVDFNKKFSSFSLKSGTLSNEENDISYGATKIKFGYKYLPLGFFYGPQIDMSVGYARYSYGLDNITDNIISATFSGIHLGAKASLPLTRLVKVYLDIDFIFNPGYTEDTVLYGEEDSATNFNLELGGQLKYSENVWIDAVISGQNSKAKFEDTPTQAISYKDTSFKIGASFIF